MNPRVCSLLFQPKLGSDSQDLLQINCQVSIRSGEVLVHSDITVAATVENVAGIINFRFTAVTEEGLLDVGRIALEVLLQIVHVTPEFEQCSPIRDILLPDVFISHLTVIFNLLLHHFHF